ncbi:hypothetical protein BCR43DRAFT_493951 [Syncephalastrum racemosum]|uniref:Uncharacterized protein n=1 Tax=Syncephalastrum racemosum TaxID=13706 RepID=A0A1X2H776_SYNRA|nr:hypothetical protein BCR43DRAFT_493951 [Syncephalastrum racemosum]
MRVSGTLSSIYGAYGHSLCDPYGKSFLIRHSHERRKPYFLCAHVGINITLLVLFL